MAEESLFLIDVEKILREKARKYYKYIPSFVVSYLKKIVHQEELNVFLFESRNKVGVDFLEASLQFLDVKIEIKGAENLPEDGLYTFVCNHPLGGQDGVALGYVLGKHYNGKVKYLVNDLLMNLRGLAPLCIPLTKPENKPKISRNWLKLVLNQTINSSCFRQVCVPEDKMELSKILNGGKLLWPKVYSFNEMLYRFILMDATRIFSIIWPLFARCWALSLISLCYIWQTKCLEIAIRLLPLHLENLFHGKRLISLKRLLNGRNM